MVNATKTRVALLFGGVSGEHGISAVTAGGIMRAVDAERYELVPIGITQDGTWVRASGNPEDWGIVDGAVPEVTVSDPRDVISPDEALRGVDVVFPVLHGPFGEDGTIQGLFEIEGLRYVGSGVLASAAGMDKHFCKLILEAQGIKTAPYQLIRLRDWVADQEGCVERAAELGLPLFVKPCRAGSSIGVTRVDSLADLPAAVAKAQAVDPKVLVESAIVGREVECAVLDGVTDAAGVKAPACASLPAEISMADATHAFYDFESKYLDPDAARLICPADLPADLVAEVQRVAIATFEALDCEGLSRVDVFVTPAGEVIVNEINTMPGFTPISMYPRMWAASGIDYPELVDQLIQLALTRPLGLR